MLLFNHFSKIETGNFNKTDYNTKRILLKIIVIETVLITVPLYNGFHQGQFPQF